MDNAELANRIRNILSDGYDDEECGEEDETNLYNELSEIDDNSYIKAALDLLCEKFEDMELSQELSRDSRY